MAEFCTKTKDIRKASISSLEENNPALFQDFIKNKISAEKQSLFINSSRNYSLANKGDLNTYALFTELNLQLINKSNGRIGIVIPSGIATDSPLKEFFEYLVLNNKIISLFDFENRKGKYFATLHTKTKYCLFTAGHNFTGDSMFGF
ncbi:MAG: restriction endonuclease, partial [Candidatus Brocadia sp. WS118]